MKKSWRNGCFFVGVLLLSGVGWGQSDLPNEVTGGFRFAANTIILDASPEPRGLTEGVADDRERALVEGARKIFSNGSTRAVLLSRKERIFDERYAMGVSKESTPLAYSMSKSLVALTVGKALCDGSIQNLDDKAEIYAPQLKGTSYGDASIRQLLMMTSGAAKSDFTTGHPKPTESFVLRNAFLPRGLDVNVVERMKIHSGYGSPGVEFNYNNYDTQSLLLVTEGATKVPFSDYFNKVIWAPSRPERTGAWLRNHQLSTVGWMGFSASPRDYLRIGYFIIDERKQEGSCFSRYLADATSNLIMPMPGRGYGYQIHKLSLRLAPDSFWFLGFGGQVIGVDVISETVVYLYSMNDSQVPQWVRLISAFMKEAS